MNIWGSYMCSGKVLGPLHILSYFKIKNNQGPSSDGNYAGVMQSGFSLAFSNTRAEIWEDSAVEHGLGVT